MSGIAKRVASKVFDTVPSCLSPSLMEIFKLRDFIDRSRRLVVVTGAGVSTESGIRDYRSAGIGEYSRMKGPILTLQEFQKSEETRRKFWLRNFVKWPVLSSAEPNSTHIAFAQWERRGFLSHIITQNIDNLHLKAGSRKVLEFHGSMNRVVCLKCGNESSRKEMQQQMVELNTHWLEKVNPSEHLAYDGNIHLEDGLIKEFKVPKCKCCGGNLKPNIIFFGEEVPKRVVDKALSIIKEGDALLVIGSSLQVYSGYFMVGEAKKFGKKVAIVNVDPTRADDIADIKISAKCGEAIDLLELYEDPFQCE